MLVKEEESNDFDRVIFIVMLYSHVGSYQCFRGTYRLHLHGTSEKMKLAVICSSKTLVTR
jgi:hypothetical protein